MCHEAILMVKEKYLITSELENSKTLMEITKMISRCHQTEEVY